MIWIPVTLLAAALQTARNASQRGLTGRLSPLGATYTRFLFGLPFAVIYWCAINSILGESPILPTFGFFAWCALGGISQIGATAALIHLFQHRNFATGIAFTKTEIVLVAIGGLIILGDHISPLSGAAILVATVALVLLSQSNSELGWRGLTEGLRGRTMVLGLLSGLGFAIAATSFRAASLTLAQLSTTAAAAETLVVTLTIQTLVMGAYIWHREPGQLTIVMSSWRASIVPGLTGAGASAGWFTAMAMEPAAHVRMLGLIEVPLSITLSLFGFRERPTARELGGTALLLIAIAALLYDQF